MVGAGSVVTRDVPPYAIVTGAPARITGYVDSKKITQEPPTASAMHAAQPSVSSGSVQGVTFHRIASYEDLRGQLAVATLAKDIPFTPKRFFVVYDVPSKYVRGEHAHKVCHQFLICVHGHLTLMVDDGANREEILMDRPSFGVYIPPMVWGTQYLYSDSSVLLVFASHEYDAGDYIRDYDSFLRLKND
jgi:dTDP-4-dehydrorhamnose 3,5-epimerase-like enzyme